MDPFLTALASLGPVGIFAAILVYDVFFLQKKMLQVIENNTKAVTELKSYCQSKKGDL